MTSRAIPAVIAIAALAACTSPAQQRIDRERAAATQFLARQGSIGDPGRVAAADFAFARMAREEGNWTAFRHYAAPGAKRDAPGGFAPVSEVLAGLADPPEPIRWEPTKVWSSCDGTLAASLGRFVTPAGIVGDYVTIWQLQSDNSYRYVYDTGTPDDPQPAPAPPQELPEGAIVVPGLTALEGRIADCARGGEVLPPIPVLARGEAQQLGGASDDGTLRWTSYYFADGRRRIAVDWVREGAVQEAVAFDIAASE